MFKINKKFLVFMALAYLFSYLQGGNLPYAMYYSFAITLVFAILHLTFQWQGMRIKVLVKNKICSTGDTNSLKITVNTNSIIPLSYVIIKNETLCKFYKDYLGEAISFKSGKNASVVKSVTFKTRGIYNFGEMSVTASDLMCIFSFKRSIDLGAIVRVFPRIYKINSLLFDSQNIIQYDFCNKLTVEDSTDVRDLRKYVMGDSLKRVNWKVSAKHSELFIKNFNTLSQKDYNIFLDMNIIDMAVENLELKEERLIDLTVSIVNYMRKKNITKIINVNNKESIGELIEYFISHRSLGISDFVEFINLHLNSIQRSKWVSIIVMKIDEKLKNLLLVFVELGFNVSIFYIEKLEENSEVITELNSKGIAIINAVDILEV